MSTQNITTKVAKVTKMSVAKSIFAQIQQGELVTPEGKSERAFFMETLLSMVSTTEASANMYYQNIHNAVIKGESLYKYNKGSKAVETKGPEAVNVPAEPEEFKVTKRWYVIDVNGKPTADFDTRAQAQNAAKETNGKWRDLEKHAA